MRIYKIQIGYGYMHEDELPDDLPQDLYDWWFNNSWIDGVRVGFIIEDMRPWRKKCAKSAESSD